MNEQQDGYHIKHERAGSGEAREDSVYLLGRQLLDDGATR